MTYWRLLCVNNPSFCPATIILAAGRSTRMGQPKLLLPWGGTTILGHLVGCWQGRGARQIGVVCAAQNETIDAELDRLSFSRDNRIYNPAPGEGMFSSILCAARWAGWQADLTHWTIVLGDQPHLQLNTLDKLLALATEHPEQVCQPIFRGKRRHPVVLPKSVFTALAGTTTADLKTFLSGYAIAGLESDDAGLELDIDRPEDYEKALALGGLTTQR